MNTLNTLPDIRRTYLAGELSLEEVGDRAALMFRRGSEDFCALVLWLIGQDSEDSCNLSLDAIV